MSICVTVRLCSHCFLLQGKPIENNRASIKTSMSRNLSNPTAAYAPPKKVVTGPRDPIAVGDRDAAVNRAAGHNYFLLDRFEAGVSLHGTEVKSIREGKANLKDAYGLLKDGEAFCSMRISVRFLMEI